MNQEGTKKETSGAQEAPRKPQEGIRGPHEVLRDRQPSSSTFFRAPSTSQGPFLAVGLATRRPKRAPRMRQVYSLQGSLSLLHFIGLEDARRLAMPHMSGGTNSMKIRAPKMGNPKVSGGPIFSQNFHHCFCGFSDLWGGAYEKTRQKAKTELVIPELALSKGPP